MNQQAAKLRWKHNTPYGLSASQFGMALGYCGRVSDYVDYLRNIVGTPQEFSGNVCTEHGIRTEPKARALYELLTGQKVHDGGFFLTKNKLLGCSPDGRIFYWEPEILDSIRTEVDFHKPSEKDMDVYKRKTVTKDSPSDAIDSSSRLAQGSAALSLSSCTQSISHQHLSDMARQCSSPTLVASESKRCHPPKLQFNVKSSPDSTPVCAQPFDIAPHRAPPHLLQKRAKLTEQPHILLRKRIRMLEIKSPFRSLYSSTKADSAPFGIPRHYMCQIQGQMSITGADECDFFVYLDSPQCQVEAWRVKRSADFWAWAEPRLLQVVEWVRDGPPLWLDRSFAFETFDFSTLEVIPLVFPFCISTQAPLLDASRFAFFMQYDSPYVRSDGESQSKHRRQIPSPLQEIHQTAAMLMHPVTKFLFDHNSPCIVCSGECNSNGYPADLRHSSLGGPQQTRSVPSFGQNDSSASLEGKRTLGLDSSASCPCSRRGTHAFTLALYSKKQVEDLIAVLSFGTLGVHPLERLLLPYAKQNTFGTHQASLPTASFSSPEDWDRGELDVQLSDPSGRAERVVIHFFDRCFFEILQVAIPAVKTEDTSKIPPMMLFEENNDVVHKRNNSFDPCRSMRASSHSNSSLYSDESVVEILDGRVYYYISSDNSISD